VTQDTWFTTGTRWRVSADGSVSPVQPPRHSFCRSNQSQTTANAEARSRLNAFIKYGTAPYMLVRPPARSRRR
jgi:hypothetical protein